MAYASSDDVQRAAGGAEKLKQLTDLQSSGEVDAVTVTEAVEEAESMIRPPRDWREFKQDSEV